MTTDSFQKLNGRHVLVMPAFNVVLTKYRYFYELPSSVPVVAWYLVLGILKTEILLLTKGKSNLITILSMTRASKVCIGFLTTFIHKFTVHIFYRSVIIKSVHKFYFFSCNAL